MKRILKSGEMVDVQEALCPKGHSLTIVWVEHKSRFAFLCETCQQVIPKAICGDYWIEILRRSRVQ